MLYIERGGYIKRGGCIELGIYIKRGGRVSNFVSISKPFA